jgi:glutamyl/glutaminyl-tRNA synthetase
MSDMTEVGEEIEGLKGTLSSLQANRTKESDRLHHLKKEQEYQLVERRQKSQQTPPPSPSQPTAGGSPMPSTDPKAQLAYLNLQLQTLRKRKITTESLILDAEIRLYDRLFSVEHPDKVEEGQDFRSNINPDSLEIIQHAKVEPALKNVKSGERYQFERVGYFNVDIESTVDKLVFNRIVSLRDSWAKIARKS